MGQSATKSPWIDSKNTLPLLSHARGHVCLAQANDGADGQPSVTAARIGRLIKARRARARFFDRTLFADPAWDILLELYAAHLAHRRLSVSAVCDGAAVPATTALRWIKTLESHGHVERRDDPMDGRRVFLKLSESAVGQMDELLQTLPALEAAI